MFGSFLPSLRSSINHSLLGSRSRHCYAIMSVPGSVFPESELIRQGWREVLSFANQKSRLETMQSVIKVGQRFKFTVLTDDAPSERQGVVIRVLSNREEGFGLDVDQYMSYWVEAQELPETESPTTLVFVRSADGKVYLDGKLTEITLMP